MVHCYCRALGIYSTCPKIPTLRCWYLIGLPLYTTVYCCWLYNGLTHLCKPKRPDLYHVDEYHLPEKAILENIWRNIRHIIKTHLQICCEVLLFSLISFKCIIDQDGNFKNDSSAQGLTLRFQARGRKGLSIKISCQKQDFCLFFILFWAPRLKKLGAHSKIKGHTPLGKSDPAAWTGLWFRYSLFRKEFFEQIRCTSFCYFCDEIFLFLGPCSVVSFINSVRRILKHFCEDFKIVESD